MSSFIAAYTQTHTHTYTTQAENPRVKAKVARIFCLHCEIILMRARWFVQIFAWVAESATSWGKHCDLNVRETRLLYYSFHRTAELHPQGLLCAAVAAIRAWSGVACACFGKGLPFAVRGHRGVADWSLAHLSDWQVVSLEVILS